MLGEMRGTEAADRKQMHGVASSRARIAPAMALLSAPIALVLTVYVFWSTDWHLLWSLPFYAIAGASLTLGLTLLVLALGGLPHEARVPPRRSPSAQD